MPIVRATTVPSYVLLAHDIRRACSTPMTPPAMTSQYEQAAARSASLLGVACVHQARRRLAVAQADRLEDLDGEVHEQRLEREEWHPAEHVEDARAEERDDVADQQADLEPDVLLEVVVQPAAQLDRLHDRREVVVGEDHVGGLLRDLGARDAHGHADVGLLEGRRVVHAVARHGDDVALLAQHVHEVDLVLGGDAGDDADVVDLRERLVVAHGAELGARDRAAPDAELLRDRLCGDGVVAGDHPDLDAGAVRVGDRHLGRRPRRVDDAHEGQQRHAVEQRQQVGVGVERRGIEVLATRGHDAQALRPEPLVLVEDCASMSSSTGVVPPGRAR